MRNAVYIFFSIVLMSCTPRSEKQNILLIIAEDISTDLSCYGNKDLKTPCLDSLAKMGELFTGAFTTSPVCSPSRSAIMTGMYQNSIGCHNHRSETGPLKMGIRPFTHLLREAGYFTCNIVHDVYGTGKTDLNFRADSLFDGTDWRDANSGQPFFAQASIYTTHRDDHWYGIEHDVAHPVRAEKLTLPSYYPDHPVARADWARYLNSIQYMDAQVAQLITRLEADNLFDNTVIIFVGDHGRCHIRGKQWLYDSGIKIPMIVKWEKERTRPQINQDLISAIDITATILDIANVPVPEYMEGKSIIAEDYAPREQIFAARDRCDGVVDKIRCVRTKRYKYIRNDMPDRPYTQFGHYKAFFYPMLHLIRVMDKKGQLSTAQQHLLKPTKEPEELYDISNDPEELINLACDSDYTSTLIEMREKLHQWEQETGDINHQFEPQEFMIPFLQKREDKYASKWIERGIDPHAEAEIHLKWWEENLQTWKLMNNQPIDKEGATRKIFKIIGSDTLYLYIHKPKNITEQGLPAIVFFHSGGWRKGASTQFDRHSEYLASRGMVAIQADYRLTKRDSITPFECVMDAKAAMRWVRKNAERLGIKPNMIAAGGGSAGGHLAAACAHLPGLEHPDEDLEISSNPDALILFNPVFDNGPEGYGYHLFEARYKEISPAHNIRKGAPPTLVQLGDRDENLSVENAYNYQEKMEKVGAYCTTIVYKDQKHGFFNLGKGGPEMFKRTVLEMDSFLVELGYLEGPATIMQLEI